MFDAVTFDPQTFDTPVKVVETYDGDYPKRLRVPETGREWDVSPGGVVITSNIHDAFLLAHDGITAVEFQPELTPEFIAAAESPSKEFVETLKFLYGARAEVINEDFVSYDEAEFDMEISDFKNTPVYAPVIRDLTEHWAFTFSFLHAFKVFHGFEYGPDHNWTMPRPIPTPYFHYDKNVYMRALFNTAGKRAWILDGRPTREHANWLSRMSGCGLDLKVERNQKLCEIYPIHVAGLGSISFVTGDQVIKGKSGDLFDKLICNVSGHSSPQDFEEGDHRLFYRIS